ncbi:MAG: hypothetical protein OZ921_05445 [Sorangiineae bacterium]|nr:hypothetical protein [Polyangiaceae bacterium]MEB2321938.1 hypothetical protein [Sorangiineae bacterium]
MVSRQKRRARLLLAGLAALVAASGVGLLLGAEPLARALLVKEARARGVVLEPGEVSLGLGAVELSGARFTLDGVGGLSGAVERLRVELTGLSPSELTLDGLSLRAEGAPSELIDELSKFSARYRGTGELPLTATRLSASWRPSAEAAPLIELGGGTASHRSRRWVVDASTLAVKRLEVGPLHVEGGGDGARLSVGLGLGLAASAPPPLTMSVARSSGGVTADLTLSPLDLSKLDGALGAAISTRGVRASGTLHLEREAPGTTTGRLALELRGFVPPHPRELDGIVFGDLTELEVSFAVDEARQAASLDPVRAKAGAFKLSGKGALSHDASDTRLDLALRGDLPCTDLARSAATSALGSVVGAWVGHAAKQAVSGSVGITWLIAAKASDLTHPEVRTAVGVGCGLKPLALPKLDLPKLDLPKLEVPGLPKLQVPGLPRPGPP